MELGAKPSSTNFLQYTFIWDTHLRPSIDVSASPDSRVEPLTAPSSPSVDQPDKTKAAKSYTTSPADADSDSDFNIDSSTTPLPRIKRFWIQFLS